MKAVTYNQYGPPGVLKYSEVPKPEPKSDEVRIHIKAATVTAGDCEIRRFDIDPSYWLPLRLYMGLFKPRIKILGQEFTGVIDKVGQNVSRFKPGDKVLGGTEMNLGAYAEYLCLPEKHPIATIPNGVSFEQAATIPTGGLNALYFLRKVKIQPGDTILIHGAGGSIGTYAIQLAKLWKAHVIATELPCKTSFLNELGADQVIDTTKIDFTLSDKPYDIILDVTGRAPLKKCLKLLRTGGSFIQANPGIPFLLRKNWCSMAGNKKIYTGLAAYKSEDMDYLTSLMASGDLSPYIDKKFKLSDMYEAHQYVEEGHKNGHIVIQIPE
jgi:NADPH:quinone reductase-like Zn-dependent oxidoreductase